MPIGVAAAFSNHANLLSSSERQQIVTGDFSQVTAENEMKMSYHYSNGSLDFSGPDRIIDFAMQNNLSVHGHALVWHPTYQLPEWADASNGNFKQDFATHVTKVAEHFAGKIESWDVVNEALEEGDTMYRQADSVFYQVYDGPEYIHEAFRLARQADPNALLYYNDYNTENNGIKTERLIALLRDLTDNQVPIDGVGFQMHVMMEWPPISDIRSSMQQVVDEFPNLMVKITELDVRINNVYDNNTANDASELTPALEQQQGQRYYEIIRAYLEVVPPARRGGVTVWGVIDPDSWYSEHSGNGVTVSDWPLIWDANFNKKAAYFSIEEALTTHQ